MSKESETNQSGTLYEDGKEFALVRILSLTPAWRQHVKTVTGIGSSVAAPVFKTRLGRVKLVSTSPPDPTKHNYTLATGHQGAVRLYVERVSEAVDGLHTIEADIGFPGE